jgi:hypothetical protein
VTTPATAATKSTAKNADKTGAGPGRGRRGDAEKEHEIMILGQLFADRSARDTNSFLGKLKEILDATNFAPDIQAFAKQLNALPPEQRKFVIDQGRNQISFITKK